MIDQKKRNKLMNRSKFFVLVTLAAICFLVTAPTTQAQVSVNVGVAPDCPYGYYDVAPYDCAPYGYYGPEWFTGGVFIGVGPWFHGPAEFHGHVNNRFHPEHGYHGALPARGEKPVHPVDKVAHFKANEVRDGRGHVVGKR
jgi:hypothetical protein